jgi:uncharacterized membrane protein
LTVRGPLLIALAAVLLVSLAGNLVVAGFTFSRFGPRPGSDIERIVAIGIRAFPPEIQKAIVDGSKAKRDEMRARFDDVRDARQRMFEAMRADPFDPAALETAYADVRQKTNVLQEAGQQIVLDAVANASPEVRSRIRPPRGPFP